MDEKVVVPPVLWNFAPGTSKLVAESIDANSLWSTSSTAPSWNTWVSKYQIDAHLSGPVPLVVKKSALADAAAAVKDIDSNKL